MPMFDEDLSKLFVGNAISIEKLEKCFDWHNQGSSTAHYGFPQTTGLWLLPMNPLIDGNCSMKLYILLFTDQASKIIKVETVVARVFTDGHYEELELPIRHPDDEAAKDAIQAILVDEAQAKLTEESSAKEANSVSVEELKLLIGKNAETPIVKKFLEQFGLRRSTTMFGNGGSYACQGCRIEVQTGSFGHIENIFLHPAAQDRWSEDLKARVHREELIATLGEPTKTSKKMGWDRFDTPEIAIHITYNPQTGIATMITLMDRSTAP